MVKRDLPKYVYRKGRYAYFIRDGMSVRVYPDAPDFYTHYAQLLAARPEARTRHVAKTFAALIDDYQKAHRYTKLAQTSKTEYDRHLNWWRAHIGPLPVAGMQRKDVIRARDALADTYSRANMAVAVMSQLLEHAIDIGWRTDNPAKGTAQLKSSNAPREPWPVDLIEAFRREAPPRTRLIMEMALGTGQRIGDVLAMQWGHIEDGGIKVRQEKTKTRLWIPLTTRLAAELERTPKRGLHIITTKDGGKLSYSQAGIDVMAVRRKIGAEAYDIHSWRYTAAAELGALGLTDEIIKSITGHKSGAMVAQYAGEARQKARAKIAQEKRK